MDSLIDIKKTDTKKSATAFILLMGIVSLFSDMTHEGANSILGSYLGILGATGAIVGFISGFGQLIGYSLRLFTGFIADKTKKYWFMTILGYSIDVLAVPLLALVPENGWIYACILIFAEKAGKAIKKPSKNTLVSFAASEVGAGKSFAMLEFVDQLGAFLGPILLFGTLGFTKQAGEYKAYTICFVVLAIPALICLSFLFASKRKYPHPENFEKDDFSGKKFTARYTYIVYIAATSLFAFGFVDFPLITLYASDNAIVETQYLPLIYSFAMIVDAFTALFFGWLYDKKGYFSLIVSTVLSAFFSIFIFGFKTRWALLIGAAMWGIGMGAQESILKATVVNLTDKANRSKGYGIFETTFGIFWFLGSWLSGVLYDISFSAMIAVSVACQLSAVPLFAFLWIKSRIKSKRSAN